MASLKTQPEFETETTTETTTETAAINESAAASVAATTAIAKASASAVATTAKFQVALADKNNVFDMATVEGLAMATPRIKAEQGSLFKGDVDLGAKARVEIISFNHRWVIGCGEDNAESKDYFRVSYDKAHTTMGDNVDDYIASLKAQGFAKAGINPYMDIFGFLTWSEKAGEVPDEKKELVCIQASKTSMGKFTAYCTTQGLMISRGIAQQSDMVEIHADKQTSGSNKYTNISFHRC